MDAVERLVAIEAIKSLKARYFRLMDLQRWDEWLDVFTEDCEMALGSGGGLAISGRQEIVRRARAVMAPRVSVHHGHMPEIEIFDDGTAVGVWSLFACSAPRPGVQESGPPQQTMGHYTDDYRLCGDGKWRIARVVLVDTLRVTQDPAASAAIAGPSEAVVIAGF